MVRFAVLLLAAAASVSHADPGYRRLGASARTLGCSPYITAAIHCEGATSVRLGLAITDLVWMDMRGHGLVVNLNQASRPEGGLVLSQTIASGGFRKSYGRIWLQAGPAMAIRDVGTRTVKLGRLLSPDVALGFAAAVGVGVGTWLGYPIELSLDVARTFDGELHQMTTSVTAHRF